MRDSKIKKSTLIYIYISLLFILFFDLWVENSKQASSFFANWLKPVVDEAKFSLVWTILILVGIFVLFKYILDAKEEEKRELEKTLDSEMSILVRANRELSQYRLQDNLLNILNRFVQQNPYIHAVQWYNCMEKKYRNQTKFKINFQYGVVSENISLNAVQQIYYKCSTSMLNEFRNAKRVYTENNDPNKLVDFIIEVYHQIVSKEEGFTKEDAILYSLVILAVEIIERDYGLIFENLYQSKSTNIQEVIDENRTGLLRASLMEDEYYSFTHTRDNEKYNRQYLARLVKVRDENVIFTIVLDAGILEEDYEKIMLDIANNFETLLKELEAMYNRSREVGE